MAGTEGLTPQRQQANIRKYAASTVQAGCRHSRTTWKNALIDESKRRNSDSKQTGNENHPKQGAPAKEANRFGRQGGKQRP
jgi:hypothetical protein